jgi:hypothetical protein
MLQKGEVQQVQRLQLIGTMWHKRQNLNPAITASTIGGADESRHRLGCGSDSMLLAVPVRCFRLKWPLCTPLKKWSRHPPLIDCVVKRGSALEFCRSCGNSQ